MEHKNNNFIYTQGNLLEADVEVLVNTVNTVGVMGKGIALMFKERFPLNTEQYIKACENNKLEVGKMFATETYELGLGPKWIINFPTKKHWRNPSKMEWIANGLDDLRNFIIAQKIKSIAIPPLGAGNGGLNWPEVKVQIEEKLSGLGDVEIIIYEPTSKYQNVAKRSGLEKLTPARAMIAELVRKYWVLGMECSLLEIQKLSWFLERSIELLCQTEKNPLQLQFKAEKYGPYSDNLRHLLNGLDGSYLHCEKRITDASPLDVIWFDDKRKDFLSVYLRSDAQVKPYLKALELTCKIIEGFESPFGMELLATIDWVISKEGAAPELYSVKKGIAQWPAAKNSAKRKSQLFDEWSIGIALHRLKAQELYA